MILCHLASLGLSYAATPTPPLPHGPAGDLGALLHDFLRHFGFVFRYDRDAVSVASGGYIRKKPQWRQMRAVALAVEDPQDRGSDISAGSFRAAAVRALFDRSWRVLGGDMKRTGRCVELR